MENMLYRFACLFVLRCHVGTESLLPEYYQYFQGVKCLAQGHNTAEVGIEPLSDALPLSLHATLYRFMTRFDLNQPPKPQTR